MISKILILVSTLLWLSGCSIPDSPTSTESQPIETVVQPDFQYVQLSIPEELTNADHLYCCYQDETYTTLSVCSDNGKQFGPLQKTTCFALIDAEGNVTTYPVSTDAYITSALPYYNSIIYVDYDEQDDGSADWLIIQTDGMSSDVIATGKSASWDQIPQLFLLNQIPHYVWKGDETFGINRIEGDRTETVLFRDDYALVEVSVCSNGKQFCFLGQRADLVYPTFFVYNGESLLLEHQLSGKITSYSISEEFAICGNGTEDTNRCSIEVINLTTGNTKIIQQPYGPLWCLEGTGDIAVCVDYYWQPYFVDIAHDQVKAMPRPNGLNAGQHPILFYAVTDSKYLTLTHDGENYAFHHLSISH